MNLLLIDRENRLKNRQNFILPASVRLHWYRVILVRVWKLNKLEELLVENVGKVSKLQNMSNVRKLKNWFFLYRLVENLILEKNPNKSFGIYSLTSTIHNTKTVTKSAKIMLMSQNTLWQYWFLWQTLIC